MIFVDTNVFMYAVGGPHPLRSEAREFIGRAIEDRTPLVTSAEVLQEFLHAYLPVGRLGSLDAAFELAERSVGEIWAVEPDDVRLAWDLAREHPGLSARDLTHVACCLRRDVTQAKTFDRGLDAVFRELG